MKFKLIALPLALLATAFASAADKPKAEADAIAKARTNYPMKTCLVSDEELGSMGEAVAHVHREAGKPDRVIFVCCEGCIDDFKKEPAKYLKKVDDAARKGGKSAPAKQADGKKSGEHKHN